MPRNSTPSTRWFAEWGGPKPLAAVAVKAALAAALAWLIILPFGGVADEYVYYAPLGAVVVVSSRLAHTMRSSVQTVLAIAIGTSLALLARQLPGPGVIALAVVVGIGTVIGAWSVLGSMSGWVPIAGLFTLVVGGADPERYMFAFLGLTAFGALIGLGVNIIAPPLPLSTTREVQEALRAMLADRLDWLADGLAADELPTAEQWTQGRVVIAAHRQQADELVARVVELSRLNWRARRWQETTARLNRQGQALGHLTFLVDEMAELLASETTAQHEEVVLSPELRAGAAEAFRRSADAVRSVEEAAARRRLLEEARTATENLAQDVHRLPAEDLDGRLVGGNLIVALRRVLRSIDQQGGPRSEQPTAASS